MPVKDQFRGWNRNAPLVIYAKDQYDKLMDLYQAISRRGFVHLIIGVIFFLLGGIGQLVLLESNDSAGMLIHLQLLVFSLLPMVEILIYFRYVLRHTVGNPINREIDEMATMEQDEIIKLNMEKVNGYVFDLNRLMGETSALFNSTGIILYSSLATAAIGYGLSLMKGLVQ